MWHFCADALTEHSEEKFSVTWETAELLPRNFHIPLLIPLLRLQASQIFLCFPVQKEDPGTVDSGLDILLQSNGNRVFIYRVVNLDGLVMCGYVWSRVLCDMKMLTTFNE